MILNGYFSYIYYNLCILENGNRAGFPVYMSGGKT